MTARSPQPESGQDPGRFYGRRRRMAATLDALRRRYSAARAAHPRKLTGTFQAPVDISAEHFARLRLQKVQTFVDAQQKQGWRLSTSPAHPIRLESGACPAYDLRDGTPREGYREYVVSAWFVFPNPKPLRIELPPWFTESLAVTPEKG